MKDIPGFEGLYAITKDGRVWSYPKRWGGKTGNQHHDGQWLNLNRSSERAPYCTVLLRKSGGVPKTLLVHRLVALTFIPNPGDLPHINHINGNHRDNRIENLEWCTPKENNRHNIILGRTQRGEKAHLGKLTQEQVKEIRSLFSEGGISQFALARQFKVTPTAICSILKRRNWYWLI